MSLVTRLKLRRKSDKVRLIGWLTAPLTCLAVFFAPDRVAAFTFGLLWASIIVAVTETTAILMDRHAKRTAELRTQRRIA